VLDYDFTTAQNGPRDNLRALEGVRKILLFEFFFAFLSIFISSETVGNPFVMIWPQQSFFFRIVLSTVSLRLFLSVASKCSRLKVLRAFKSTHLNDFKLKSRIIYMF
jgi:hypothetical protein